MDRNVSSALAAPQPEPYALTFAWLCQRVQDFVSDTRQPAASKLERWSFWIGLGMAGLGLVLAELTRWVPPSVLMPALIVCLVTEVVGLTVSLGLMVKRELPQFVRPRQTHAADLDLDFVKWQELVTDLRRFPSSERKSRLRFVITLRQNMAERMGLVFGGTQRLGILPLLAALYLQFRNWKWGDWAGAFDVNMLSGLIIWAMLLLYAGGWLLVGLRCRLDSYVSLLENSLQEPETGGGS